MLEPSLAALLPLSWIGCSEDDGLVGSWRYETDRLGHFESWEVTADGSVTHEWMFDLGAPRMVQEPTHPTQLLELDADGSARWERTHDDGSEPELRVGTWREVDGSIELIQAEDGDELIGIRLPTLDGVALADLPLERAD